MDEARRRHYLKAMGIPLWQRRQAPGRFPDLGPMPGPVSPAEEIGVDLATGPLQPLLAAEMPPPDAMALPLEATAPAAGNPVDPVGPAPLDWEALAERVHSCRACDELVANRTQTVFGVGPRTAQVMVIGEAPGADEDRQGEPFVGRAGQLLNQMLRAIGLPRERVFIANVLKCRPPGNRDPKPEEAARCEPFLLRQIELVNPALILSVGRISAQNLLKTGVPVGQLRGRVHRLGPRGIPLIVTYHPAYLLRSPEQKARAWDDLQLALRTLGQAPL